MKSFVMVQNVLSVIVMILFGVLFGLAMMPSYFLFLEIGEITNGEGDLVEAAGVDVVLVGDSLAMVVLGHATTLPVTLEQMLHHTQAVGRGFKRPINEQPLVVCDLPFLSYQCGEDKAVAAAGILLKDSCAAAVKIEGAEPEIIAVIERLIRMGIPVMGHLGLTPQSVHNFHRPSFSVSHSVQIQASAAICLAGSPLGFDGCSGVGGFLRNFQIKNAAPAIPKTR